MSDHASLSKFHGSVTPQNSSAFHALFLSATRPSHSSESNSKKKLVPYLILFQHTQHFSQRVIAAEPDSSSQLYRNAGLLTPKESSIRDSRGDLFVKEAWRECVHSCSGKVIFVKCSDSIDFGLDTCGGQKIRDNHKRRDVKLCKMFEENGVVVDLSSGPLDWDEPGDEDDNDDNHPGGNIMREHQTGVHTIKGEMCNIKSILLAIQDAASHISTRCRRDATAANVHHPIPIIFDSLTPLVLYHGVEKVHIFLTMLKQTKRTTFLSPIFIPLLSEILSPPGNRILEDYSDAVMTLYGGKLSIAKRSARNGGMMTSGLSGGLRLVKEVQYFDVQKEFAWNELLLTKGGEKQNINQAGAVRNENQKGDADLQHVIEKTQRITVAAKSNFGNDETTREKTKLRGTILMHENENEKTDTAQQQQLESKPKPVIYLEENDPEFQDLDEEDPDDDLDI
jgi:hypothetical protein